MSIQPSVIIWTVICFCLFAFIMNKLLFKPLLRVMDERKARTEKAHADAEAAELTRRRREEEALLEAQRAEADRIEEYKRAVREYRAEADGELKAHAAELESAVKKAEEASSGVAEEAFAVVCGRFDGMIDAFTEKLVSGGGR